MTGEGILVRTCMRTKIHQVTPFIKEIGIDPDVRMKLLRKKLMEEVAEVITSEDPDELLEELGDVVEVIYEIAECAGWEPANVEFSRHQKTARKGGFGVILAWKQPEE